MNDGLALKYRPATFWDMVGQDMTATVLRRMVVTDKVPQGLLFSGVRGSGKTSAARILASQVEAGDAIEVDAASHGSVEDVRQMIESLRFSAGGRKRVIIYDEAHSMSREAFNALLKTLEEPPADSIFILVTTEPDKIPGTVKSRLMEFSFKKITPAVIFQRLSGVVDKESIPISAEVLKLISTRADGSLRDALMLLDQCWKAEVSTVQDFLELSGEVDVAPDLVLALLTGNTAHIFEVADTLSERVPDPQKLANDIVQVLKDILILKSGGEVSGADSGKEKRRELALSLESERVLGALRVLWDLKTKVRQSGDPRSNLDLALVLISEVFTRGRQTQLRPVPKVVSTPDVRKVQERPISESEPRRLTLSEL